MPDLSTPWGKVYAFIFGVLYLCYWLNKHDAWSIFGWILKAILVLCGFSVLLYVGEHLYSYTDGGAEGVIIAIVDIYYLISPLLFFKYASLSNVEPTTKESRLEEAGVHFVNGVNFVVFEGLVILSGIFFYAVGMCIVWALGY